MSKARKTPPKKAAKKPAAVPKKSAAFYSSQTEAVQKNANVKIESFKFQAIPSEVKKDLITNESFKRFHGTRLLASWLPREFYSNNKDRFGYLFPSLRKFKLPYTADVKDRLSRLGDELGSKDTPGVALDSTIPSGYTYFGQFVDHDITLDVNSDISKEQDAKQIPNMRSPSLDLDAIYGRGPGLDPFLYDHTPGPGSGVKLLLGRNTDTGNGGPSLRSGTNNFGNPATIAGGNMFDVPRTTEHTAIIGDPRNDENLIVSQLHHSFLKFHNKVVDHLIANAFAGDLFTEAKKLVTHHYQWIVMHDFLMKVADPVVVQNTLRTGPRFFKGPLMMPVEFAVAAYRFGHSMIRNDYFVNAPLTGQLGNNAATLAQVFQFIRVPLLPVTSNWVVDFNLYFQARPLPTANGVQFNHARKIDTRLAAGLELLPGVPASDVFMKMLAKRNLVRGLALGLPSGQSVAKLVRVPVLTAVELKQGNTVAENAVLDEASGQLLKKTPLWYYILKEAEVKAGGQHLGKVGSTILAETFVKLLKDDPDSFLNTPTRFRPSLPRFGGAAVGDFTVTDLLNFAGVLTLD